MATTNSSDLAALIGRRHANFSQLSGGKAWSPTGWDPMATPSRIDLFSDPRVANDVYASKNAGFPYNNSRCKGGKHGPGNYYRENVDLIAQYAGVPSGTMNQMCSDLSSIARGSDPYKSNTINSNKNSDAFKSWLSEVRWRYGA